MHQSGSSSSGSGNGGGDIIGSDGKSTNGHFLTGDGSTTGQQGQNGTSNNGFIQEQPRINFDKTNQEIIRLIGQYLQNVGLNKTSEQLIQESGCYMEHPVATEFRKHVITGDWTKADNDLKDLRPLIDGKQTLLTEMKFILLEQKYLEFLEDGRPLDALHVLRNELTPLQHNISRVHQLSSYMMCANNIDLYQRANWRGKGIISRSNVMERLQVFLPPNVMLPPRRLRSLLRQAVEMQTELCSCHDMSWETNLDNVSLLTDHSCLMQGFPMQTLQILTDHCDEVWFCKFSPDGIKLATGSKDGTFGIWDVDPHKLTVKMRRCFDGQSHLGVPFVEWSPDSKLLMVLGPEECPEVCIWNIDDGRLVVKMSQSVEDSLSCAAFNKDGTRFVCGGTKGQFYLCDLNGTILDNWEGVRVNCFAFRSDNKTILAADTHNRIRGYHFDEPRNDFKLIQEQHPIMTFSVNSNDSMALLNIASQGLHLWDLEDKCLVRRFQGVSQGSFTIYSCFGGVNESFVASGSEDNKVYIWHIKREKPLAKLSGHTKTVNCVSWNPVFPSLLASSSDDRTVRIWGPKTVQQTNTPESDDCSSCSSSSSWNMTS